MKRMILAFAGLSAVLALGGCASTSYASEGGGVGVEVSAGGFHEALAPYGEWVNHGTYGSVWRPSVAVVGAGFRPYGSGGRWVYSDVGWSWQSDWDWGWAPFHYGRWILDPVEGWVWVPDTVWGPAWVSWRYGGGYAGWAPLAPVGFVEVDTYHPYWCFVPHAYLTDVNVFHYATGIDYHQAFAVTNPVTATVTINGSTRVWAGPPVGQIQQATGHAITPVQINAPRPGVIAPHTINGVPAPQIARSGGGIPNSGPRPGTGTPGVFGSPGTTGAHPGATGPGVTSPGATSPGMHPPSAIGQLHTQPNQPVQPQNPAYRSPQFAQPGTGYNRSTPAPYQYGYHAQPAPQRTAPQQPAYRSAPQQQYRQPAPVSRQSAPAAAVHTRRR